MIFGVDIGILRDLMHEKDTIKINNISIRLATREDDAAIIQLQCESIRVLSANDYPPKIIEALLKNKSNQHRFCFRYKTAFVAEYQDKIIAFASLNKRASIIIAMFVLPSFARQGIGTKILRALEQEAIENNIKTLWVISSLIGHKFYLANGYKNVAETSIAISPFVLLIYYVPCIAMKKTLLPTNMIDKLGEYIYVFWLNSIGFIEKMLITIICLMLLITFIV